jgi:hypothetical protein
MSRSGTQSTTNPPPSIHKSTTSDTAQGERLSEETIEESPEPRTVNVSEETSDMLWVDWDGPNDPMNPKKWVMRPLFTIQLAIECHYSWTYRRKWAATLVVSSFTFISPVSSSMIAPATGQVATDLGITSNALIAMTTSIFVLGYGKYFPFVFRSRPILAYFCMNSHWTTSM